MQSDHRILNFCLNSHLLEDLLDLLMGSDRSLTKQDDKNDERIRPDLTCEVAGPVVECVVMLLQVKRNRQGKVLLKGDNVA